jgi:hypothetical protein
MKMSILKKTAKRTTLAMVCCLFMAGLVVACDSKKGADWLFVLTAKHGEIAKNTQGQYVLTLKDQHMQRVLAFTDRPQRLVKEITVTQLKDMWSQGADSFKQDPPNAVIVINGQSQPVVLTSIKVTSNQVQFTLKQDGAYRIQASSGPSAVFIDALCSCFNPYTGIRPCKC